MALTFPRDFLHDAPMIGMSFPPQPMQELTPLRSGEQIAKDLGPTLWRPSWRTDRMTPDETGRVRAFHLSLLSLRSFYGYDKLREYPLAYAQGWGGLMVGGQPFDGTCTLADVPTATEVALTGLPVGFQFSEGDYLAFDYGAKPSRALHMVIQGGLADAGGAVTVEVGPYVRIGWSPGASVTLHRPSAELIVLPNTYAEDTTPPHFTTVSFEAIQRL